MSDSQFDWVWFFEHLNKYLVQFATFMIESVNLRFCRKITAQLKNWFQNPMSPKVKFQIRKTRLRMTVPKWIWTNSSSKYLFFFFIMVVPRMALFSATTPMKSRPWWAKKGSTHIWWCSLITLKEGEILSKTTRPNYPLKNWCSNTKRKKVCSRNWWKKGLACLKKSSSSGTILDRGMGSILILSSICQLRRRMQMWISKIRQRPTKRLKAKPTGTSF